MSSHFARGDRRRRVLHEEARAATLQAAVRMSADGGGEAPRYGELAGVEHHPQITDYVPRRKRAVLATLAVGTLVAALAEALVHGGEEIAAAVPGISASQVAGQLAGGLVSWTSAVMLLTIAGLARLVYSLRRHRIDDLRGRYRVWRAVAWMSMGLSMNAVLGLHSLLAGAAVAMTGWSLTPGGSEWWLVPSALVGGWIALRVLREVAECRSALAMVVASASCYAAAAAGSLGWSPTWLGAWSDALTGAGPVVGHALGLAATMLFARYVVLDVQGLIEHKPRPAAKQPAKPKAEKPASGAAVATIAAAAASAPAARRQQDAPAARVDQDDEDADDDDAASAGRYLSKADRKRLRKQQQQRRAA